MPNATFIPGLPQVIRRNPLGDGLTATPVSAAAGAFSVFGEDTGERYFDTFGHAKVATFTYFAQFVSPTSGSVGFNTFFHGDGGSTSPNLNLDTSLPGDGTGSFASGAFTFDASGNVTALSFSGNGSGLTNLTQGNVTGLNTALALLAPLASPTFTGVPAGPTAALGTNTTQFATTAFVLANSTAGITALTGDVTASGSGSVAATLATVNANVGSFGSATQSVIWTVNGKGLVTAAANVTITPAVGSITGLGTGVATALAVNVGSAGAFLTYNGDAGTPSAIVLTNASGTASININGTVGATTANTGAFTTLATTGNVSLGNTTNSSTATPITLDMGGTFGNTIVSSKAKIKLYSDGTAANTYGIGIASSSMNFFVKTAASFGFYVNNALQLSISSTGVISSATWNGVVIGTAYGGTGVDNSTGGTANQFWARPDGATGAAAYRAIVSADVPTLNQSTTGSAATLTTGRTIGMTGDVVWTSPAFNGGGNVTAAGVIQPGVVTNAMLAGSIAYSKLSLTGAILNADLAGSIAYSKLSLTGAILNADLAGSIAYSKLSLTGAILNADLAGSIAYSKLSLTGAVLNADLAGSIAYSKLSLTGAILNADLAGSIAYSKLSLTGAILNADLAGGITEAKQTLSDNTTADVSTSAHGYAPKAPADATKFLNGANPPAWTVPAGGASVASPSTQVVGLIVVNGVAATAMRSDAAPPLAPALAGMLLSAFVTSYY